MSLSNIFALEGPDGVGKTTVTKILVDRLRKDGRKTTNVRLPGSTPFGEAAREILLMRKDIVMSPMELGLVFTATHVSVMNLAVELSSDSIVIMDRSYWSNYAYRTAEGMTADVVMQFNAFMPFLFDRDHGLLLNAPIEVLSERLRLARGDKPDRFESRDGGFQQRVYDGYQTLLSADLVQGIDANRAPEEVAEEIFNHIVMHSAVGQAQQVFGE